MNVTIANGEYVATFSAREMRTLRNRTSVGAAYGRTCAAINEALNSVELPAPPAPQAKIATALVTVGSLQEGDTFLHAGQPFEVSALDDSKCESGNVVIFDPAGNAVEYELENTVTQLKAVF